MTRNIFCALPALFFFAQPPSRKPPEPLKHGPLAYFKVHCSRCHLDMGAGYPDDFTKDKTPDALRDVVKTMAADQGGSPLSDQAELEAQVAFHYAIDLKKPFVAWTGRDVSKLSGEVTPNAKLSASLAGVPVAITIDKGVWTVVLPASADPHKVVLTAKQGSAATVLDLGKASFSLVGPASK